MHYSLCYRRNRANVIWQTIATHFILSFKVSEIKRNENQEISSVKEREVVVGARQRKTDSKRNVIDNYVCSIFDISGVLSP